MTWLYVGLGWLALSIVTALGLGWLIRHHPPRDDERKR